VSTVAEIEEAIDALPPSDFAALAAWFEERQAARMDAALERAVASGRFDAMADKALRDAEDGKTIPLDEFLRRS
jgi:hypothetical protein